MKVESSLTLSNRKIWPKYLSELTQFNKTQNPTQCFGFGFSMACIC